MGYDFTTGLQLQITVSSIHRQKNSSLLFTYISISLLNERIEKSHNGDSREKARVNRTFNMELS
jgi:hypothetical protein